VIIRRPAPAKALRLARPGSASVEWLLATLVALAILFAASFAHAADPAATVDVPGRAPGAPASFADLAERLLPAVVNVSTTQTLKKTDQVPDMPQFPPGSPFEEFFKDFMERQGHNNADPDAPPRRATALGSGFIIDPSGLVVTNNHVIADADEITVILHDETAYKAKVVGRDTKADLALLKLIDAPAKVPFVAFGNSDESRVGDWVIAVGNPFGLGGSVTAGIVSARARDINAGPYDDFIQTDAAINKGNSGGPLFNLKGEVIGINTAIFSPTGGSIGIGFSIPSNLAKPIVADLQKYGKTRRGWLGVRIQTVTDEIADSLGLKEQKGALVAGISPGGPAAKAGLKPGDVITRFDGKDINEMRRLPRMVAETSINREVEVQYWRDGKKLTTRAVVGELPADDDAEQAKEVEKPPQPKTDPGQTPLAGLGFSVAPVSPALRERFNLRPEWKGVVVVDVNPNGQAADKGIRPGDVIEESDREAVKSPADFAGRIDAARKGGKKQVFLLINSGGDEHFITLRLQPADKKESAR